MATYKVKCLGWCGKKFTSNVDSKYGYCPRCARKKKQNEQFVATSKRVGSGNGRQLSRD